MEMFQDDDNQDADTENFLVEIDCLTSKVLRETSLWNIQGNNDNCKMYVLVAFFQEQHTVQQE